MRPANTLIPALAALLAMVHGALAEDKTDEPVEKARVGYFPLEVDPASYLDRIRLPEGFSISIYREGLDGARSMAMSERGTLFLGTRSNRKREKPGVVYAVTNPDGDGRGDALHIVAQGLNVPNGVALKDGHLYIAEVHRVVRLDGIEARLEQPPEPVVINDSFPDEYHHGWKYLRFGPDGRLYVPVGAPCNICEPEPGQGTIVSLNADGSDKQVFAEGVRNSVGFDWDPATGDLWFTDNGRDLWGEDTPPEELNHAPQAGQHFGYPYRYGKALVDDSFATSMTDADFSPAALEFPAHNALLGMRFYTGSQFPADYSGDLFIASHGSWNREIPDGYKIFRVMMEQGRAIAYEEFASGWLTEDNSFWGRPVDIEWAPDGAMLVSDDFNGLVYRISYGSQQPAETP